MHFASEVKVEEIVYRVPEVLFAAEIVFSRLDGHMSEQELDLLKLTAATVAQLRTGSAQVMRGNVLEARSLAAGLDYVPDNVLRDATPPYFSKSGHRSKDFALTNAGSSYPLIESAFDPGRNRDRADVATFADQVHHSPVSLAHLDVIQLQAD